MSPLQRKSANVFILARFCCAAMTIGWMKSAAAFTSVSSLTLFGHLQQQRANECSLTVPCKNSIQTSKRSNKNNFNNLVVKHPSTNSVPTKLYVISEDLALVIGQETYGFGIVILAEAIYSFSQAPSLEEIKVLIPGIIGAVLCAFVAGPMVTSGDPSSVALGLEIATGTSLLMGATYVSRLFQTLPTIPKEIAFLGLLVCFAGFTSFTQNLLVNGFISLPSISIPSLPMPPSYDPTDAEEAVRATFEN